MNTHATDTLHHNVACPFCGLCCDDLTVQSGSNGLSVIANGCERSKHGFAEASAAGLHRPRIRGTVCSLEAAISRATDLLRNARQPLIAGLGTDVAGARAALHLADRCGAIFDHMNSTAMLRNLLAVHDSGWMTTTLTEVRNRADLVLLFDSGIDQRLPRFFERFIFNSETLFGDKGVARELIIIGPEHASPAAGEGAVRVSAIPCPIERTGDIAMALRSLLKGRELQVDQVGGVSMETLQELIVRLCSADYGVLAWSTAALDFPHAELAVQAISELVKDLNASTRCAGLPLGGDNGDHSFTQVATWQTGFPTRACLCRGYPHYDPVQYDASRLLRESETDLLLWISAFDTTRTAPSCTCTRIVLGRAGMHCENDTEVFIPVATPGLDHAGHVHRCDAVATLPLRRLRNSSLAPVHEVLHAIIQEL